MAEHVHWKKEFNPNYLGTWALPEGKDMIVQIKDVKKEEVKNQGGTQIKPVMYFENGVKPLVLNKTDAKAIEKALGTPYQDEWVGKKIQLYIDPAVSAFGEIVSAVRVREFAPEA